MNMKSKINAKYFRLMFLHASSELDKQEKVVHYNARIEDSWENQDHHYDCGQGFVICRIQRMPANPATC